MAVSDETGTVMVMMEAVHHKSQHRHHGNNTLGSGILDRKVVAIRSELLDWSDSNEDDGRAEDGVDMRKRCSSYKPPSLMSRLLRLNRPSRSSRGSNGGSKSKKSSGATHIKNGASQRQLNQQQVR